MHFNTNHKNTWTFNLPLSIFQNYLLSKKWFSYIYFFFLSYFLHSHFFWLRKMNFSFLSSYCYTLAIWYFIIFLLLFSTYWVSGLFYSWILLILRNLDSFYKFWNQKNTFYFCYTSADYKKSKKKFILLTGRVKITGEFQNIQNSSENAIGKISLFSPNFPLSLRNIHKYNCMTCRYNKLRIDIKLVKMYMKYTHTIFQSIKEGWNIFSL